MDEQNNSKKNLRTYVCKRTRMAKFLMNRGFTPYKITPDRDNPLYYVFLFTATPELYAAVSEYFTDSRRKREMSIFTVVYHENSDCKCGADVRVFASLEDARAYMQAEYEATLKDFEDAYNKDGIEHSMDDFTASIEDGKDTYSWEIREHFLNVRVAVKVEGGRVRQAIANAGVIMDVYDVDTSMYPDDTELEESERLEREYGDLRLEDGWREIW